MSGRDWCGGPCRAGPSVRGRTLFVRTMSVSYGVLSSSGMGRFWRIFVSTSRKSGGKLRQTVQRTQRAEWRAPRSSTQTSSCQSVQRMFKGQRRVLESQARTGSCRTSSNNQPSVASRKTCVINIIVSFVKKHGRSLLPAARWLNYLLARGASETRSRVDLYSANNDMILVASQQNYKSSAKWRNCSLRIMSIYHKQGGQSVSRYTGFLIILPANVSDLPILVIRKQGAGECQYCVHAFFHFGVKTLSATVHLHCVHTVCWADKSEMWMISAEIWLQFYFVLSNHLFLRICNSTRPKVTRANSFLSATIFASKNIHWPICFKIYNHSVSPNSKKYSQHELKTRSSA